MPDQTLAALRELTEDEKERLLETARAAQVAGTFPTDSAIRLLTDDYGWNESEQRHCMAAARLALAYWGHAWGYLATNHHAPAPDQVPDPTKMVAPLAEGEGGDEPCEICGGLGTIDETLGGYADSNQAAECPGCGGSGCVSIDATPPAEGDVGELVDFLERLGSDHDDLYPPQESRTLYRAADLLKQQAAELAECREALRRVRLEQRIPGGGW